MFRDNRASSGGTIETAIKQRDHNQCQVCHRHESETPLEIYQIVPRDADNPVLSNYVLLCEEHYKAAQSDRGVN